MAAMLTSSPAMAQEKRKSFDEFRKEILNGYSDFRKTILDHYADFLNGEWHEYESLNGERRDKTPKPYIPDGMYSSIFNATALPFRRYSL